MARQLGHGAGLTMGTYCHVIDELEDAPSLDVESAIRQARSPGVPRGVSKRRSSTGAAS